MNLSFVSFLSWLVGDLHEFDSASELAYPYKVLEGTHGLRVGEGVELQWKMQSGGPFGWWYGRLEALKYGTDGKATATITFRHFPTTSRWYKLQFDFGDGETRPCAFGGYTGGLRAVTSEVEEQRWKELSKSAIQQLSNLSEDH